MLPRWPRSVGFLPVWDPPGGQAILAVHRLPLPLDLPFLRVEQHHDLQKLVEQPLLLPGLKAFMQRATTHPKPVFVHRFPLAPGPQDIPNPFSTARLSVRGRPGLRFFGALGGPFLNLRHIGCGTRKQSTFFGFGVELLLMLHLVSDG